MRIIIMRADGAVIAAAPVTSTVDSNDVNTPRDRYRARDAGHVAARAPAAVDVDRGTGTATAAGPALCYMRTRARCQWHVLPRDIRALW